MGFILLTEIMEKGAIFIDGGYLSKVLKNHFSEPRVDYLKLSNKICDYLNVSRLRTYFYDCMPVIREKNESDTRKYAEKQKFISKIQRLPRFEV